MGPPHFSDPLLDLVPSSVFIPASIRVPPDSLVSRWVIVLGHPRITRRLAARGKGEAECLPNSGGWLVTLWALLKGVVPNL